MTRICNFPISDNKSCTQPVADDRPNCGRHGINLSADQIAQIAQDATTYEKNGELHLWDTAPDGPYCLLHRGPHSTADHDLTNCLIEPVRLTDRHMKLHNDNGPAVIEPDGEQLWYQHGKLHRTDGPAVIRDADGERFMRWMDYDRDEGWPNPELIPYGDKEWWVDGKLHREDGPAVIAAYSDDDTGGLEIWYQNGVLHREGGPAFIVMKDESQSDSERQWWVHGKLHRDDGPAVTDGAGVQYWYQYGELHRDDGPAVTESDGARKWYWHGEEVTEEEHAKLRARFLGV